MVAGLVDRVVEDGDAIGDGGGGGGGGVLGGGEAVSSGL